MEKLSKKNLLLVSLMLFSMFFGAGNLIFPPLLGQLSGSNLPLSLGGFLVSAVGLPVLAVATIAKVGGLHLLASKVHKSFALIFTVLIYLSIGPFLGIPRAGSLAFEMGIAPFLPKGLTNSFLPLFIYTLCYFSLAFWLSINPSKLIDRLGKILTPIILTLITIIFIAFLINPFGSLTTPIGDYNNIPFLKGFLDGYMTMDALAALNFGIVIAFVLEDKGITTKKALTSYTIKAGVIAGLFLTLIYGTLSYLGGCAQSAFGATENGAQTLTNIVFYLFNKKGLVILGIIFSLACLSTSVGLITSCSEYFSKLIPKIKYKTWVIILCVSSMTFANVGLTKILKFSVPVINIIYPIAIVLVVLSLFNNLFKGYNSVYLYSIILTLSFSALDLLNQLGLNVSFLSKLPLYDKGLLWVVPAILGAFIGFLFEIIKKTLVKNSLSVEAVDSEK